MTVVPRCTRCYRNGHLAADCAAPVHLVSSERHDENSMWCADDDLSPQTAEPGEATCAQCLIAAKHFGERAADRLDELRKERS